MVLKFRGFYEQRNRGKHFKLEKKQRKCTNGKPRRLGVNGGDSLSGLW